MAKRRFRLGVWLRLGIVVTAFWVVGATTYGALKTLNDYQQGAWAAMETCEQQNALNLGGTPRQRCDAEYERVRAIGAAAYPWSTAFLLAVGGAILGWIIFGILYGSIRWILAGRRKPQGDSDV